MIQKSIPSVLKINYLSRNQRGQYYCRHLRTVFKHIKLLALPVFCLVTGFCASQNNFNKVEDYLSRSEIDSAYVQLQHITLDSVNRFNVGLFHYYSGIIYKKKDLHHTGFSELLKARDIFTSIDSLSHEANTNYEIYDLLTHQEDLNIDKSSYLDAYLKYSESNDDPLVTARAYSKIAGIHLKNDDLDNTLKFYRKNIERVKKNQ